MKKILSLFSLLLFPTITLAQFSDVSSNHTNKDAITYVQQQNIVNGYPDGTFKPNWSINRAEFTKIIISSQFNSSTISECNTTQLGFSDVPNDAWFTPFVCVAKAQGIIGGYPDGTFKPSNNIALSEASKIITKTFGYQTNSKSNVWYEPFIQKLGELNAIPTDITDPSTQITRGQMAEMIYRIKTQITNKPSHSYASLTGQPETKAPTSIQKEEIPRVKTIEETPVVETKEDVQPEPKSIPLSGELSKGNYQTTGRVIAKDNLLTFQNLSTNNGPRLRVYLSTGTGISDFVDLGDLQSPTGTQSYTIPTGTDLGKYDHVLIWCEPFGVLFGSAQLR